MPITAKDLWIGANEFVKSPIFVFFFGASFIAYYPKLQESLLSKAELDARHMEQQVRTDAQLIAPFIPNLVANDPARFQASAAALQALEIAAKNAHPDEVDPMFQGVNSAILKIANQLWPQAPVTPEITNSLNIQATLATTPPTSLDPNATPLANAIVYIQVAKDNETRKNMANALRQVLNQHSILAPKIEEMPADKIPQETQVRYFNPSDKDTAEALAELVKGSSGQQVYTVKPDLKAKPGTLEVWFGKKDSARG